MLKKRPLRAVSIFALAGLAVIIGVESHHAAPHQGQAKDTTWAVVADNDASGGDAQIQPLDTTW
ncbi:hypothetical protein [Streptomyces sp. NPDC091217]|uniref:hypothetical protein n=1 Tax=Streptomyces sp. NPDC091217 TaxID=3365975 RepID=UPI003803ED58